MRREEILTAAVGQMAERGLAGVRVADVATALGVSAALVFYHFESKDRLVAAAFEYAAERDLDALAAVCARRAPAVDRLRAALRLYLPSGSAPEWQLWLDGWAAVGRNPELRKVLRDLDVRRRAGLSGLIAEGAAQGDFACDDPAVSAARITSFLDGLAVQLVVRKSGLTKKEATAWLAAFVGAELGVSVSVLAL